MTKLEIFSTSVDGEWVRFDLERSASCGSCFKQSQCFISAQKENLRDRRVPKGIHNSNSNQEGLFLLEVDELMLLWCSALGYLLPAMTLCLGAIIGKSISQGLNFEFSELFSIISGLSGLALGFLINRWVIAHFPHWYRVRPAFTSEL